MNNLVAAVVQHQIRVLHQQHYLVHRQVPAPVNNLVAAAVAVPARAKDFRVLLPRHQKVRPHRRRQQVILLPHPALSQASHRHQVRVNQASRLAVHLLVEVLQITIAFCLMAAMII